MFSGGFGIQKLNLFAEDLHSLGNCSNAGACEYQCIILKIWHSCKNLTSERLYCLECQGMPKKICSARLRSSTGMGLKLRGGCQSYIFTVSEGYRWPI